ncbi:hypothetical protein VIGAN_10163000, partial [Vigna angularis var. angularis]
NNSSWVSLLVTLLSVFTYKVMALLWVYGWLVVIVHPIKRLRGEHVNMREEPNTALRGNEYTYCLHFSLV